MKIEKLFFTLGIIFAIPQISWAAPSIQGATGTFSNGQSITITGSSFGSGPTVGGSTDKVVLFDDFSKGTNGNDVAQGNGSALVGGYISQNLDGLDPEYSTDFAHSGTKSMKMDWLIYGGHHESIDLNNPPRVFWSAWHYIPVGKNVPGTDGEGSGANYKLAGWIVTYGDDVNVSNMCGPVILSNDFSNVQGGGDADDGGDPALVGRDHASDDIYQYFYTTTQRKGSWIRFDSYFKAGMTGTATLGDALTWEIGEYSGGVRKRLHHDMTLLEGPYTATQHVGDYWDKLNIPAFGRQDNNSQTYIDDIYVATGNNCLARVEIGNASTYANCTNLAIATPTNWSSSSITATLRSGSFMSGSAYLYVLDSSNTPNAAGYPITLGGSTPTDTTPPGAPTGLSVS